MTHEELQREYRRDVERGVLPAPGERFASMLVRDEDCPSHIDECGLRKIDETPAHIRITVRYLTWSVEHGVWVHVHTCEFTGHGNEMWGGNDSEALADFRAKYPIKLETP